MLRIFGPKRDEVIGEWRKLGVHNEEPNVLYSSPNNAWEIKLRRIRWGGTCSAYGKEERRIRGFSGETCGKDTTGDTQA